MNIADSAPTARVSPRASTSQIRRPRRVATGVDRLAIFSEFLDEARSLTRAERSARTAQLYLRLAALAQANTEEEEEEEEEEEGE